MSPLLLFASACLTACAAVTPQPPTSDFCPVVYRKGIINMPVNASFLHVENFSDDQGSMREDLLFSSFFNAIKDKEGRKVERFSSRDLVGRIPDIANLDFNNFDPERDVEILSDLDGVPRQVWPNETSRVPDDIVSFEAVMSPQGFLSTARPGRLTRRPITGAMNRP